MIKIRLLSLFFTGCGLALCSSAAASPGESIITIDRDSVIQGSWLSPLECGQVQSNTGTVPGGDGIGGVVIEMNSLQPPYLIRWTGPESGEITGINCNGIIEVPDLLDGVYQVAVIDNSGNMEVCSFTIAMGTHEIFSCDDFAYVKCQQELLEYLKERFDDQMSTCKQWAVAECSSEGQIYRLGKVGINTSHVPDGYSLAVRLGILTDKMRIELCEDQGWCDYVFDEHYPLPALHQVEDYIQRNKHLPGSISQAEVTQQGGFELKQVALDHQQKIEEIFLYAIQIQQKIDRLKTEVMRLRIENELLINKN